MNLLLIPHICLSCHDDTLILTNHLCLFQEDTHMRTNTTHKQKTNNMNNEDAVVEMNTDINVAMEIKLGKVSLNHDTCMSWSLLQKLTFDVIIGYSTYDANEV